MLFAVSGGRYILGVHSANESADMSYGHGGTRRLRFVVDQVGRYVAAHVRQSRSPLRRVRDASPPPALALACLRGEAILTLRFFAWCEGLALVTDDPDKQWYLHEKLIANRGRILDLVNRIGLAEAVATQTVLPAGDGELAYRLYCGLLNDLERGGHYRLLEIATDFFFAHGLLGLFPNRPVVRVRTQDAETLRVAVLGKLRKRFRQPVELKERFRQDEEGVRFALRFKLHGRWHHLPEQAGKRLKPVRITAYKALLGIIGDGKIDAFVDAGPSR